MIYSSIDQLITPFKHKPRDEHASNAPTLVETPSSNAQTLSMDKLAAVEPSFDANSPTNIVYLEGIPEHLHSHRQQSPALPKAPTGFDDQSLESIMSSLEDAELISLDDDSYYFTPCEERPCTRMEKLKRELNLRSELLEYLNKGQSAEFAGRLVKEEEMVQAWTLQCAQEKEDKRKQQKAERRRQRHLKKQQEARCLSDSAISSASNNMNNNWPSHTDRRPTAQEAMAPRSLFDASSINSRQHSEQETSATTPVASSHLTSSATRWSVYWSFEWHYGMPALVSFLLNCVTHAALYELVLSIVMRVQQPWLDYRVLVDDNNDSLLEPNPENIHVEDLCYGIVLVLGLILARASGLLFSFSKQGDQSDDDDEREEDRVGSSSQSNDHVRMYCPEECHLDPRRIDRQWAQWTRFNKKGRLVKGLLDVVAFYLCFVSVMYFLGRVSLCFDQRSSILEGLPSRQFSRLKDSEDEEHYDGVSTLSYYEWDSSRCRGESYEDSQGNAIVFESGPEDEAYLFEKLSTSAYQQFWGRGYRAAMFDLKHQLSFNFACCVISMYTLRRYFGCSFWEDW